MAMIGGSAQDGTGLAGSIVEKMQEAFGDSYKLTITMPDESINETPALGTDAMAAAIVDYIKANAVCSITIDEVEYFGTIL